MVTELRTLRVTADMDASQYTSAAQQKVAADRQMAASGRQANAALGETGRTVSENSTKISQAGDILSRLSRQYVDGYASSQRFNQAINQLTRGVELGKIQMSEAMVILDGIYRKYGLMADASRIAQRGQIDLAHAIEQANAKLTAQRNIAPANMNRQGGLLGGMTGTATEGGQNFNAANAAYQFQDIAVTAAMGMSPLMIGLQQGTQLASVVGSMERPVMGLAAAFGSLVSPVSLVTIGLTAGAAALIQYVSSWGGGEKISEELQKQNELITRVAKQWGDATPALKAYADELERVQQLRDAGAAGQAVAKAQFEDAQKAIATVTDEYERMILTLSGNPDNIAVVEELTSKFQTLVQKLAEGTATSTDLNAAQTALNNAMKLGSPDVAAFGNGFEVIANKIRNAIGAMVDARDEAGRVGMAMNKALNDPRTWRGAGLIGNTDGPMQGSSDPDLPLNGPVIQWRPKIELEGLPGTPAAPTILNSDGRMVNVPIPGQRPNYFERESDLQNFTSSTPYWSRDILLEEKRRAEVGGVFKGFFTDFGTSLRNNSGDLGKALIEGLSNSMMNAASQAWDKFAQYASTAIVNAIMGQPSAGLLNKGIGFTGANTTLGQIVGAGGGLSVANDNVAGGFSGLASVPTTDIAAYIRDGAIKRGIDPNIALRVAQSEGGLNSWNLQSNYYKNGVREQSFGPFQLYKGGGLGNEFMAKTGLDPALAANGPAATDFALDHAARNGWGAWYGAGKAGIGNWQGIGTGGAGAASDAVGKLAEAAGSATKGLDTLGGGLGKIGQGLSTSFFPAAPAAASGGGGGGLFSWIGNLFGPNLSKYAGLTGLFADGTEFAPGGLAMVGERGREIVNLPRGSQVVPNHRTESMLAANGNRSGSGRNGPIPLNVNVIGANGDEHVRKLVEQGVSQALAAQNEEMVRTGFGEIQRRYAWQKA